MHGSVGFPRVKLSEHPLRHRDRAPCVLRLAEADVERTIAELVPSAFATITPDLSPTFPEYAISFPSGEHSGSPDPSSLALNATICALAIVTTNSWPNGRRGPSFRVTVYATRVPSGDNFTVPTLRNFSPSAARKPAKQSQRGECEKKQYLIFVTVQVVEGECRSEGTG